jgi:hypothetical protein
MTEGWLKAAEQIVQFAGSRNASILGFLSIDGNAGVSTLSRAVCHVVSLGKAKVALIDLASPAPDVAAFAETAPKDRLTWHKTTVNSPAEYDVVAAAGSRHCFNDGYLLQHQWKHELETYSTLVLDLPPVLHERSDLLSPLAAATSCDAVFLVCLRGKTAKGQLAEAIDLIRLAGINLFLVINDRDYTSPGEEIARTARACSKVVPRLASWVERKVLSSELLT